MVCWRKLSSNLVRHRKLIKDRRGLQKPCLSLFWTICFQRASAIIFVILLVSFSIVHQQPEALWITRTELPLVIPSFRFLEDPQVEYPRLKSQPLLDDPLSPVLVYQPEEHREFQWWSQEDPLFLRRFLHHLRRPLAYEGEV